jgi:photosystem II stability/assembly factor-like uncharacterized protein
MRRFFLVACLALVFTAPARAALNRWTSGGPLAGGPVEVLAFDPNDPGTVYAGTYGGVFRSEDHGVTWTAASFGLAGAVVTHIEADPDHPGTVYVATHGGFQKSTDGGRNWQVPTRSFVTTFALAPSDPQTLYAAQEDAVVKSIDGGASWELGSILPGEEIIRILEVDPLAPANVYAGTNEGLFRSVDGGSTFTPLSEPGAGSIRDLAIDPADPGILYAATSDGVFKSADRGLTWAQAGLAGQHLVHVAIDPASPSTLLAVGLQVFRSTNAGASWTPLLGGLLAKHTAAFDPSSASVYLLGTGEGVYRSTDQGQSWLPSNSGLIASFVGKLAVDPHRPGVLFAATGGVTGGSGALYKSADAGASWSLVKGVSGVRALAFDPKTPSLLYAATDGGILRSQDGGSAWVRINASETTGNHIAIDPQTPSTLYLSSFFAGVRKSVDGGLTWSAAGPDVEGFGPIVLVIAPSEPQTVFAGDFQTGLYRSTDGGATWTALGGKLPEPFVSALAVDPTDADVVYASVSGESIYKSTDGGTTWFPLDASPSVVVEGIAIDPSQPSRLYATNSRKGIFRSTDGGATWSPFDDGRLADLSVGQILLDPVNPHLLYVASDGGGVLARADLQPGSSLRLNGDRFLVKMSWETVPGVSGRGQTHTLTGDTGYAWFFQESNVEVLLKVLDGCGLTGHFWVFAAGLTNVRTDITVADTQTRAVKIYHNPAGQPFQPIQDVNALACDAAASAAAAGTGLAAASGPSGPILLRNGRFQVTAEFVTAPGAAPQPMPGALLTDDAAYLWFFDPNNVEIFLKVVDGCPVNGRFWVFAAGLTNVEVRITVVDTQTGEPKVYVNPPGQAFQPILDTSAFEGCGQ